MGSDVEAEYDIGKIGELCKKNVGEIKRFGERNVWEIKRVTDGR